tara:strand:- start:6002 stop:7264 length:1263 start_codon:yes stop_codon:yes gene_type:complete
MKDKDISFIHNKDKIFSIQIYIPVGSIHEKKGKSGISHFLEHMKFRKSKNHSTEKFINLFDKVSVSNAYTTKDHTCYYLRTNDDNWEEITNLMYELVFNTSFKKNEIEIEKKIILEEKLLREPGIQKYNDIEVLLDNSILHKDNPYNKKVIGLTKDIKSINNKDLKKYNKQYFNDYLIVISCVKKLKNKVKKLCIKLFPDATNYPMKKLENTQSFKYRMTIRNLPVEQNNVVILFKSFSELDKNKFYIDFIQGFLGNSMNSLLGKKLRYEKGYTYSVRTSNESYRDYGCFRITVASNKNNNIYNIINIIFDILTELKKNGITEANLKKFKKKFLNNSKYFFKDRDNQLDEFGTYLYYDRGFTIEKYIEIINGIDIEKLKILLRLLFDYNTMSFILYGNLKNLDYTNKKILNIIKKNRKLI